MNNKIYYNENGVIFKDKKILYRPNKMLTFPGSTHSEEEVLEEYIISYVVY